MAKSELYFTFVTDSEFSSNRKIKIILEGEGEIVTLRELEKEINKLMATINWKSD